MLTASLLKLRQFEMLDEQQKRSYDRNMHMLF
jgi:hypothetical protein